MFTGVAAPVRCRHRSANGRSQYFFLNYRLAGLRETGTDFKNADTRLLPVEIVLHHFQQPGPQAGTHHGHV